MVQKGCDQLVDILLTGWWGGKWELASSTSGSTWSGVYMLVGSTQFLPPGGGFSLCKTAQRY